MSDCSQFGRTSSLGPFEIQDEPIRRARTGAAQSARTFLNAGRGTLNRIGEGAPVPDTGSAPVPLAATVKGDASRAARFVAPPPSILPPGRPASAGRQPQGTGCRLSRRPTRILLQMPGRDPRSLAHTSRMPVGPWLRPAPTIEEPARLTSCRRGASGRGRTEDNPERYSRRPGAVGPRQG